MRLQAATTTGEAIEIGEWGEGDVEHATWAPPPHWPGGSRGDFSGPTPRSQALGSSRLFCVAGVCGRPKRQRPAKAEFTVLAACLGLHLLASFGIFYFYTTLSACSSFHSIC